MGTTLTGTTPQDTYDSLIKVTDNGPLSGTAKYLSDGLGNDSALALSTSRVGVSSATPRLNLMVRAADAPTTPTLGTASGHFLFGNGATTVDYGLMFGTNNDGNSWVQAQRVDATATAYNLLLQPSGGNVGIGTSAPNAPIQINGAPLLSSPARATIRTFDTSSPAANVGAGLMLGYQFDTGSFVDAACVQAVKENATLGNYATSLAFLTRANGVGFVENVRILSSGGITFNGDTAAANALDDYEEGTWTMGISFGGGTTGIVYNFRGATYTKIGRQVTVNGYMALTSKGTSTGIATITGLPFTVGSATGNYSAMAIRLGAVSFTGTFQALADIATTSCSINQITEAGVGSNMTNSNFEDNSTVMISLTYFV